MSARATPEISLRLLEIFAAMMRGGTTVETAEALGISQPAVSAGLRQLEAQLGIVLFERTSRRMTPTAEAEALFTEIRPMFSMLQGFTKTARDIRQGLLGRLRIIATPPIGHTIAPLALKHLLAERPDVSVSFDVRRLEHVVEAVHSGRADLGIAITSESYPSLHAETLHETRMVALVADDLTARPSITPDDLIDRPFIGLEVDSKLGSQLRAAFQQHGHGYLPHIEVRYVSTAAELVNHGLGNAIVDPFTAHCLARPQVQIRPFDPACAIRVALLTRRGVPRSQLVTAFVAALRPLFDAPLRRLHA
ncbi:LysR family transcriptional regulator [Roseicyclus mahoneyensis]|uniref:DNA-binding transcriptional LysR family regulator n=1 Tax=Roseicyclus mahoneyensis TaxID=164332 RepID=A0A316GNL1_9RHOB|nr:LysR family transcriptional regulator [Roseicyclus mahoneyensis]PWK62369.1 DNA-binding transcriptional LysR family regulator [Roseicyclus mahoneyensis]